MMAHMLLGDLDAYFRSFLRIDDVVRVDPSLNGVQLGKRDQDIRACACAVDASLETFRRAQRDGADMLFVHHGIFFGDQSPVTGNQYDRIRFLMNHDMALYACHLPLDMHMEYGNNAVMAARLGLKNVEPFGQFKGGFEIGVRGTLPEPKSLDAVIRTLFTTPDDTLAVLRFGPEEVSRIALVSGGGPKMVHEAIDKGMDLFITGDASHDIYHACMEAGINTLFAGHYASETWGVHAIAQKLWSETDLDAWFVDVPTGL
jgi:dinuclear metal center YbgI/SA1388 family protein